MNTLPDDLINFLRQSRQLEYDVPNSTIGPIRMKTEKDLELNTISFYPATQSIIDDPYSDLDGLYIAEVIDLISESEDYDPEGLLCWVPSLKSYACIDAEHGTVLKFMDTTWSDISENPIAYLDAQWDFVSIDTKSEIILPWLHFPFELEEYDQILKPYPSICSVHVEPVIAKKFNKPPLFNALRQRELSQWIERYTTYFPCSGVPVTEDELLCCIKCHEEEAKWISEIDDAIIAIDEKPNEDGWLKCPFCGKRFKINDKEIFKDGVHLMCGQKISIMS